MGLRHVLIGIVLLGGCGVEGPPVSAGCERLAAQWEAAGPFEALGCRELEGRLDDSVEPARYVMELETRLRVRAPTQVFAAAGLSHESGGYHEGALHPAGEVLKVRDALVWLHHAEGWQPGDGP